jgi:hypothetical protein
MKIPCLKQTLRIAPIGPKFNDPRPQIHSFPIEAGQLRAAKPGKGSDEQPGISISFITR